MRDPKRISRICKLIESFWYRYPDMRFFQLLYFIENMDEDLFYLEDDVLENKLNDLLKGMV